MKIILYNWLKDVQRLSFRVCHLFLVIISLFLAGCVSIPERLGISEFEWESLSPEKQKKLLADNSEITKDRDGMVREDEEDLQGTYLAVNIYDGKVMLPPSFISWRSYKPIKFKIFEERCLDVDVVSQADENIKTVLGACFHSGTLYLDPSRYDLRKKLGTVSIHSSPLWGEGFTYQGVNSNGYVQLNNVTVKIKKQKTR